MASSCANVDAPPSGMPEIEEGLLWAPLLSTGELSITLSAALFIELLATKLGMGNSPASGFSLIHLTNADIMLVNAAWHSYLASFLAIAFAFSSTSINFRWENPFEIAFSSSASLDHLYRSASICNRLLVWELNHVSASYPPPFPRQCSTPGSKECPTGPSTTDLTSFELEAHVAHSAYIRNLNHLELQL